MGFGTFAGGAAQGFNAGADTAAKIAAMADERDWRQQSALAKAQQDTEANQLAREKLAIDREQNAQTATHNQALIDLYKEREQNDKAKDDAANKIAEDTLKVHQQQANTDEAYKAADIQNDKAKIDLDRSKAEWENHLKEQDAAGQRLAADAQVFKTTGKVPDGMVDNFTKALGYHPSVLAGPEGHAALSTFQALQQGQMDLNDPKVYEAARVMFPEIFKRGMHEQPAPDGKQIPGEITGKDIADILQTKDGKLAFTMRVHYKDTNGKEQTYLAPLTQYGSSHGSDEVLLVDPEYFSGKAAEMSLGMEVLRNNPQLLEAVAGSLQKGRKGSGSSGSNISVQKTFDAGKGKDVLWAVDKNSVTKQEIPTAGEAEAAPKSPGTPSAAAPIDPKKLNAARALWGGAP